MIENMEGRQINLWDLSSYVLKGQMDILSFNHELQELFFSPLFSWTLQGEVGALWKHPIANP